MRVIAGTAKGRPLKAVPGLNTRPTTDKVKEAVFSMIGPFFPGGVALDLFAGTGGLGIEALSRGIDRAVFVDRDKASVDTVRDNVRASGFTERAEIYRNEATRALKALAKRSQRLDLVFLDPPYRMKIVADLLADLVRLDLLNPGATIMVEQDAGDEAAEPPEGLALKRRAEYGDTAITIYTAQEMNA